MLSLPFAALSRSPLSATLPGAGPQKASRPPRPGAGRALAGSGSGRTARPAGGAASAGMVVAGRRRPGGCAVSSGASGLLRRPFAVSLGGLDPVPEAVPLTAASGAAFSTGVERLRCSGNAGTGERAAQFGPSSGS